MTWGQRLTTLTWPEMEFLFLINNTINNIKDLGI